MISDNKTAFTKPWDGHFITLLPTGILYPKTKWLTGHVGRVWHNSTLDIWAQRWVLL